VIFAAGLVTELLEFVSLPKTRIFARWNNESFDVDGVAVVDADLCIGKEPCMSKPARTFARAGCPWHTHPNFHARNPVGNSGSQILTLSATTEGRVKFQAGKLSNESDRVFGSCGHVAPSKLK
jgi:hypothetical protein